MTQDAQSALRRIMENYSKITRFCLICNYVTRSVASPLSEVCPCRTDTRSLGTAGSLSRSRRGVPSSGSSPSIRARQRRGSRTSAVRKRSIVPKRSVLPTLSSSWAGRLTPSNAGTRLSTR